MTSSAQDATVVRLLDQYRAVNNDESLSIDETEEALGEIAQAIRDRQAKLLEEEGHTGIGER